MLVDIGEHIHDIFLPIASGRFGLLRPFLFLPAAQGLPYPLLPPIRGLHKPVLFLFE